MEHNKIEWSILVKNMYEELSDDEKREFELWLKSSDKHKEYYDRVVTHWTGESMMQGENLKERLSQFESFVNKDFRNNHVREFKRLFSYAAVFVVTFSIAVYFLFFSQQESRSVITEKKLPVIESGGYKAMIIASDGSTLNIEDIDSKIEIDGASVEKKNGTLSYVKLQNTTIKKDVEIQYNTVVIPKGGEYKVVLEDGTEVWLNSDSKLIFPVKFSTQSREVTLEGEGYFQVTKETLRPFVVTTAKSKIKVYGTSFNVSSYMRENEDEVVTLASGRIGVTVDGSEHLLEPRQQIVMSRDGTIKIHEVNPDYYCGWNRGIITFENESLDGIMRKLSRWYEIEVAFQEEELKELIFTGDLDRYTNFNAVINMICQTTNIAYKVEDGVVIIYKTHKHK